MYRLDEENVKMIISNGMREFKRNNCFADICIKDVHIIQKDPISLPACVKVIRSVVEA